MINPYTANPEDILIEREERNNPETILLERRRERRIRNQLFRLSLKEVIKQNSEAQKNVIPCEVPITTHFRNITEDPLETMIERSSLRMAISY